MNTKVKIWYAYDENNKKYVFNHYDTVIDDSTMPVGTPGQNKAWRGQIWAYKMGELEPNTKVNYFSLNKKGATIVETLSINKLIKDDNAPVGNRTENDTTH